MRLFFEAGEIVRHVRNNKFNVEIIPFKFNSKYRSRALLYTSLGTPLNLFP